MLFISCQDIWISGLTVLVMEENGLITKVNFKICDDKDWKIDNYNREIVQYLKKQRQLDNEIWSVNKI